MTEEKALQPLSYGNVLIVGTTAKYFDDDIRNHPRIVMWDSQNENWTHKNLPENVRAVFLTRYVGHTYVHRIIKEARKRQITIFNSEGTGKIIRQVRELLALNRPIFENRPQLTITVTEPREEQVNTQTSHKGGLPAKLHAFIPHIDWDKSNRENARLLFDKAKELGITTTINSLAQFMGTQRRKHGIVTHTRNTHPKARVIPTSVHKKTDVVVDMLDNMVKELQDMRQFFVAVTDENAKLKTRIDKFKRFLSEG